MNRIDSLYLACIHDGLSKQASEYSHNPFIVQAIEQEYLNKIAGLSDNFPKTNAYDTIQADHLKNLKKLSVQAPIPKNRTTSYPAGKVLSTSHLQANKQPQSFHEIGQHLDSTAEQIGNKIGFKPINTALEKAHFKPAVGAGLGKLLDQSSVGKLLRRFL